MTDAAILLNRFAWRLALSQIDMNNTSGKLSRGLDKTTTMKKPLTLLFLCTGNSCRGQMAEGWAKHLKSGEIDAYSAGVEKHGLNPLAVRAMAEAGVDIAGHFSKTVDELPVRRFDYVITLCGHANETCPIFGGGAVKIHAEFDDPPALAQNAPTEEAALTHYRRVRDEIKAFVEGLPGALEQSRSGRDDVPLDAKR